MSERCSYCGIETEKHHQQWVNVSEMHPFDKNHENCDSFKNDSSYYISHRLAVITVHDGFTIPA